MPNAHIIGLGKSGIAAARLLNREGWQVVLSDRNGLPTQATLKQDLERQGIKVILGYAFDPTTLATRSLPYPDQVVVSPGVPWDVPGLVSARSQGIETIGETELAWRYLQKHPWIGITGTNGKTTTTALVAAIFKAAGLNAPACGNIGYSACELALAHRSIDWVIAELSSYQIEASPTIAPKIGVWTTFTADHLGRHGTIESYWKIKASLLNQSHQQILNGNDAYLRRLGGERWTEAWWTSTQGKADLLGIAAQGAYFEDGWVKIQQARILPVASLQMPGLHNQQNLLLAVATAHLAGIAHGAIAEAVSTFTGVPHRLERVATCQGTSFINDSKATNYDAAQMGLAAVAGPVILIAGGEPKAGEDTGWLKMIHAKVAAVLLIGEAAPAFARRLFQVNYHNYEVAETMEKAVSRAATLAKQYQARSVLLSPACASFDQYQNFEQRGDHFRQLCQDLLISEP